LRGRGLGCIYNQVTTTRTAHEASKEAWEIASDCLASRARQLNRQLSRLYDGALRSKGITGSQLGLLVAIELGVATPAQLGRRLDLEKSTVSRNLARLEAAGLVDTSSGLGITARGSALIRACHPLWRRAQAQAVAALPPRTLRLLSKVSPPATSARKGEAP
jgi:DNA-binding MarR family transcriptional regulator